MSSTKLNNGIPVEENPLTIQSKIEYLNGLAVKNNEPRYLISENEENQILNNQKFIDEYNKPYKLRVTYQVLEEKLGQIQSYVRVLQDGDPENEKPDEILNFIEEIIEKTKHSNDQGGKK